MCVHVDRKVTSVDEPHTENEKNNKSQTMSAPVLQKIALDCLAFATTFPSWRDVLDREWCTFVHLACAFDCTLWRWTESSLPFKFGHLPFECCNLLLVCVAAGTSAVYNCEELNPVFHPVLRVCIRRPESSLKREPFFKASPQCCFPELVLVLQAVSPGTGPHFSLDVSLKPEVVLVEQLFKELWLCVLCDVYVHSPPWLA